MTSPTTAAELRSEYRQALIDATRGLPHETVAELLRGLDVLLNVTVDERASGLGPTETWLSTPYPKRQTSREIRIRYRYGSLDDGFVAVAYRNGACYGNPFGYGASIEEACASLMNRLTVEAMTPDDGGKDG